MINYQIPREKIKSIYGDDKKKKETVQLNLLGERVYV